MSGQLATSETILVSAAGVIAADSAGLSSVKSYSALLTAIAGAPLASPTFTGTPAAPTATAGTNTTQIATTAFVTTAAAAYLPLSGGTLTGNVTVNNAAPWILIEATTTGSPYLKWKNASYERRWLMDSGGNISFENTAGGNNFLYISTAGRFGVGNFYPGADPTASIQTSGNMAIGYAQGTSPTIPSGGIVSAGNIVSVATMKCGVYTVATLPSAASNAYCEACVSDSNAAASGNYGATVAGGGSNKVRVFSDGTNWVIA